MANKRISDLTIASSLTASDILHIIQSSTDKQIAPNIIAEFMLRSSDYADVIETRTSDNDYAAADLEPDHKIFANPTAGDVTLGLFNGSTRDGAIAIIQVVGSGTNVVNVELVSSGVTDYELLVGDLLIVIWDDTNSEWLTLFYNKKEIPFIEVDSNITMKPNRKYIPTDDIELALPTSPKEGDKIEIVSEGNFPKVTQSDAEHIITEALSFNTTKGSTGYLQLNKFANLELIYKGVDSYITNPGSKISNPAILPAGAGNDCAFSPSGRFLAVAHDNAPFVTIYDFVSGSPVKLSNPATLPAGNGNGVAWSYDEQFLAVAHDTTPYITIYQRSGTTFTKVADPTGIGTTNGLCCKFSWDTNLLYVGDNGSTPSLRVYSRSGITFTRLTTNVPTGISPVYDLTVSFDDKYVGEALPFAASARFTMWRRANNKFYVLAIPSATVSNAVNTIAFHPDSKRFIISETGATAYLWMYKIMDNDGSIRLLDQMTIGAGTPYRNRFSADGYYILAGGGSIVHRIDEDVITALTSPTPPAGNNNGMEFSNDGKYYAIAHASSPYISIYDRLTTANKVWKVKKLQYKILNNFNRMFK